VDGFEYNTSSIRMAGIEIGSSSTISGPSTIDLSGFFLTDDLGKKKQWAFAIGTIIGPGGFLLIWADNAATGSTPTALHATFN